MHGSKSLVYSIPAMLIIALASCVTAPDHRDKYYFEVKEREAEEARDPWHSQAAGNTEFPAEAQAREKEEADLLKEFQALKKVQGCPLLILNAGVGYDSIGTPVAQVVVYNDGGRDIDAFEIDIPCYNTFGDPVMIFRSNVFRGIMQNNVIAPGENPAASLRMAKVGGGYMFSWNLYGFNTATRIKNAAVRRIHFTDDTVWARK